MLKNTSFATGIFSLCLLAISPAHAQETSDPACNLYKEQQTCTQTDSCLWVQDPYPDCIERSRDECFGHTDAKTCEENQFCAWSGRQCRFTLSSKDCRNKPTPYYCERFGCVWDVDEWTCVEPTSPNWKRFTLECQHRETKDYCEKDDCLWDPNSLACFNLNSRDCRRFNSEEVCDLLWHCVWDKHNHCLSRSTALCEHADNRSVCEKIDSCAWTGTNCERLGWFQRTLPCDRLNNDEVCSESKDAYGRYQCVWDEQNHCLMIAPASCNEATSKQVCDSLRCGWTGTRCEKLDFFATTIELPCDRLDTKDACLADAYWRDYCVWNDTTNLCSTPEGSVSLEPSMPFGIKVGGVVLVTVIASVIAKGVIDMRSSMQAAFAQPLALGPQVIMFPYAFDADPAPKIHNGRRILENP